MNLLSYCFNALPLKLSSNTLTLYIKSLHSDIQDQITENLNIVNFWAKLYPTVSSICIFLITSLCLTPVLFS